jgi:hypothetical protein
MLSSPLPRGISANSMCWSTMRASSPTIFVAVAVALLQRIDAVGAFGAHGEFDRQRALSPKRNVYVLLGSSLRQRSPNVSGWCSDR